MPRSATLSALTLGLVVSLLAAGPSVASPEGVELEQAPSRPLAATAEPTPEEALEVADEVLDGDPVDPSAPTEGSVDAAPTATMALRDLFTALPRLRGSDRERADALLARPTDRGADPQGDGYRARSRKICGTKICVHWVSRTADAPPNGRWVRSTLRVMTQVWRAQVNTMGYRAPLKDGRRGGNKKLDVYLKELGSEGLYGYCAPERVRSGSPRLASGYCVLDDDFARSQFGQKPARTLRVTAAHEFSHAVQFGYDYREDKWLMESTATWMEERFADGVNDNRQYLPFGQLGTPAQPLDTFDSFGFNQYGNWLFVEYLSKRFGPAFVRKVWNRAGHHRGGGRTYSTAAVRKALPRRLGFRALFRQYAMANTTPAASYSEGRAWGAPGLVGSATLGRGQTLSRTPRVDHLASAPFRLRPAQGLDTRAWRMRVTVDGPAGQSSPVAGVVRVTRSGSVARTTVSLDAQGRGSVWVPFNRVVADRVFVVLGNASTRFRCNRGTTFSCQGIPRDDNSGWSVDLRVQRR